MNLKGKKVVVTGADGFIGSHLTEKLVKIGANVTAFTYYNSFGSKGWLDTIPLSIKKEINFIAGDIRDQNRVRLALKNKDVVFHLAALIGIPYSYISPESYIDTNVKGTLNVLQAAKDFELSRVIQTSTSEVYGSALSVPITEQHPLQGQSPYSATKIGADQLALSFYLSFKIPIVIVRPFNTYGPRQSTRAVIPSIITQLLKNDFIELGNTNTTRDFNFVADTVNGFIACAESEPAIGEIINIGSGYEISINDLVTLIANKMNKNVVVQQKEKRLRPKKSEVQRLCADNTKAKKLTHWNPDFTNKEGLENGISLTIDWFTDEKNLSYYNTEEYNV